MIFALTSVALTSLYMLVRYIFLKIIRNNCTIQNYTTVLLVALKALVSATVRIDNDSKSFYFLSPQQHRKNRGLAFVRYILDEWQRFLLAYGTGYIQ